MDFTVSVFQQGQGQTPPSAQGAGQTQQQPPAGQEQPQGAPGYSMFIMFGLMFLIFWFLVIRPQRKEQKRLQAMVSNLKKNDHVLTSGGVFGVVAAVRDNEFVLKIDEQKDVRIRIAKSAVVSVVKVSSESDDEKRDEVKNEAKAK